MSRGVKDLRELICVSRLTVRESSSEDEEDYLNNATNTTTDEDQSGHQKDSRQSSGSSVRTFGSDSGIGINGVSPVLAETSSRQPETDSNKKKKKRKKQKSRQKAHPQLFDSLPEGGVASIQGSRCELPPINPRSGLPEDTIPIEHGASASTLVNFDFMMVYIDANVVSDWLQRANIIIQELAAWAHSGENFVHFAQFWLSAFPEQQKKDIFRLEYGVVVDELSLAFRGGLDTGAVTRTELSRLVQAVLREYPGRLLSPRGPHLFLDHLDILTSERSDPYRRLLTDVKLSTRNKTYAQWVLSIRSFGLVNVWSAVVNFYRELVGRGDVRIPRPMTSRGRTSGANERIWISRIVQAINYSYLSVLEYACQTGKVCPRDFKDSEHRNLVFLAVSLQQPEVLIYLIRQVHPPLDVNAVSETGNTPLHAAVCSGNLDLVRILVETGKALIDSQNHNCDDSTPLHMAVLYGQSPIVKYLLDKGASPGLKSNGKDALQMAQDFEHSYIVELLTQRTQE